MMNKIALQIRKDQESCVQKDAGGGKSRSSGEQVMPRYPRFQSRFLYQGDNWGHRDCVCRPQVNATYSELSTDNTALAGKPMDHCVLNGQDTCLLESAAGWQRHHFAYMEQLIGTLGVS